MVIAWSKSDCGGDDLPSATDIAASGASSFSSGTRNGSDRLCWRKRAMKTSRVRAESLLVRKGLSSC